MKERIEFVPPQMDTSQLHRKWLDVAYASQSPTQKLDIYLPQNGDGPFPVIWLFSTVAPGCLAIRAMFNTSRCSKAWQAGFAVVCINYRLSGEAIFPAQIYDCKAAIRFLRANAGQYLLDTRTDWRLGWFSRRTPGVPVRNIRQSQRT